MFLLSRSGKRLGPVHTCVRRASGCAADAAVEGYIVAGGCRTDGKVLGRERMRVCVVRFSQDFSKAQKSGGVSEVVKRKKCVVDYE